MDDEELAALEEEIKTAYDTFRGMLTWIPDPYERGLLLRHLDNLNHSASKWLDTAIREAATGTVPSATSAQIADSNSGDISPEGAAKTR
jgi:hypothetical protein